MICPLQRMYNKKEDKKRKMLVFSGFLGMEIHFLHQIINVLF